MKRSVEANTPDFGSGNPCSNQGASTIFKVKNFKNNFIMKILTIDGRLGRNAELKTTSGGTKYIKFTIANNEYERGETITNWYDVITYSDFTIEHQLNLLTSGTYVIISGIPKETVNVKDGRVYLNLSINALKIDIPSFKKKEDEGGQEISTYTASTKQSKIVTESPKQETVGSEERKLTTQIVTDENSDDDLPF